MTDPAEPDPSTPDSSDPDPSDPVADLVDEVLGQASELVELDGPRAEVWASDVLALAAEIDPDTGPADLLAALEVASDPAAAVALAALSVYDEADAEAEAEVDAAADPPWRAALGTSRCDGAWLLSSGAARSAAFRFTDAAEVTHVLTVDLEPGPPETAGEVAVGPGGLLDALAEEDARITAVETDPARLAARVADAVAATERPPESLVAAARLLALRLGPLAGRPLVVPAAVVEEVPPPPPRDPDDDAYALAVLTRALGPVAGPDDGPGQEAVAVVAELVAPTDLAPFTPAERDAVAVLEWADWLGAVVGLVRAGVGAPVGGDELVDAVNRCPEVTTTIPKADRARVAWAFDVATAVWPSLGLVADGRLTERGTVVLPAALARAWHGPGDAFGG